MNPYQNYLQPNMTQNMNNQFNNYVQGLQNQISTLQNQIQNYQQYFNNMQQQIPAQQNKGIATYIVDSFEKIPAECVPMDGFGAVFIARDGSMIQTRKWESDGSITPTSYKLISDNSNSKTDKSSNEMEKLKLEVSQEVTGAFKNDIESINDRLATIEKSLSPKRVTKSAKEDNAE